MRLVLRRYLGCAPLSFGPTCSTKIILRSNIVECFICSVRKQPTVSSDCTFSRQCIVFPSKSRGHEFTPTHTCFQNIFKNCMTTSGFQKTSAREAVQGDDFRHTYEHTCVCLLSKHYFEKKSKQMFSKHPRNICFQFIYWKQETDTDTHTNTCVCFSKHFLKNQLPNIREPCTVVRC